MTKWAEQYETEIALIHQALRDIANPSTELRSKEFANAWAVLQNGIDQPKRRDPNFVMTNAESGELAQWTAIQTAILSVLHASGVNIRELASRGADSVRKIRRLPPDQITSSANKPLIATHEGLGRNDAREMGDSLNCAAVSLFYSYSHADEALRNELIKHLATLRSKGIISDWHDRKITAGTNIDDSIDTHINEAEMILLLVSSDFLASDYCRGIEVRRALERHENGDARVIPIILRPVYWKEEEFASLLALPTDGKAITTWTNQDSAWLNVVSGLRKAIGEIRENNPTIKSSLPQVSRAGPAHHRIDWKTELMNLGEFIQTYCVNEPAPPDVLDSEAWIGERGPDFQDRFFMLGLNYSELRGKLLAAQQAMRNADLRPRLVGGEAPRNVHTAYSLIQQLIGQLDLAWKIRDRRFRLRNTPTEIAAILQSAIDDPDAPAS